MNNLLNKMERKIGKYAISNLSLYLIIGYAIGYFLLLINEFLIRRYGLTISFLNYINLDPYLIFHGQIWRIFTWILIPPSSFNIFTLIMLFFYYSIGTSLERTWGSFRYNVYLFSGMLFTVLGAILLYLFPVLIYHSPDPTLSNKIAQSFSTYYVNLSIFLAFAACYPDMRVLLYFIIPIKIKWMAYLDIAILAFSFFMGNMAIKVAIVTSLLNFLLFFLGTRNYKRVSPKEVHRKAEYKKQTREAVKIHKHKCAICGRTEDDGDDLEFRFCSKCNGNYEYCQEHLFTHIHK